MPILSRAHVPNRARISRAQAALRRGPRGHAHDAGACPRVREKVRTAVYLPLRSRLRRAPRVDGGRCPVSLAVLVREVLRDDDALRRATSPEQWFWEGHADA